MQISIRKALAETAALSIIRTPQRALLGWAPTAWIVESSRDAVNGLLVPCWVLGDIYRASRSRLPFKK